MELRLPLEVFPGRQATCRAVFGTWGSFPDDAIRKDASVGPPKYLVFFKAKDADAMEAAFKEFSQKALRKEERPSVLDQLRQFKELVAVLPGKVINREKKRELDR